MWLDRWITPAVHTSKARSYRRPGFGVREREAFRELRPKALLDRRAEVKPGVPGERNAQAFCCQLPAEIESVSVECGKGVLRIVTVPRVCMLM